MMSLEIWIARLVVQPGGFLAPRFDDALDVFFKVLARLQALLMGFRTARGRTSWSCTNSRNRPAPPWGNRAPRRPRELGTRWRMRGRVPRCVRRYSPTPGPGHRFHPRRRSSPAPGAEWPVRGFSAIGRPDAGRTDCAAAGAPHRRVRAACCRARRWNCPWEWCCSLRRRSSSG